MIFQVKAAKDLNTLSVLVIPPVVLNSFRHPEI